MLRSALNNVIVQVSSKFLIGPNRFLAEDVFNPNSRINPADYVQIVGEVVSVPKKISNVRGYEGYSTADIRPKDTIIFSYSVIYNYAVIDEEVVFKNRVYYRGEEYFLVDIQHVYAVIRDSQIRMQNGYVMISELPPPPIIILQTETKRQVSSAEAILTHIGRCLTTEKPIDVMPGDTVYYNPTKLITYKLNEKEFGILRQYQILGKKIATYENFAGVN